MKVPLFLCFLFIFLAISSAVKISYKFDQDVCLLHSYPRGEPEELIAIGYCRAGYGLENNYCKQTCKPGYDGVSEKCMESCPEGFSRPSVISLNCFKDVRIQNPRRFTTSESEQCKKLHGKCVYSQSALIAVCTESSNLQLVNECDSGYYYRAESENPKYTVGCRKGLEKVAGGCYEPCEKGYHAVGNACTKSCPVGYLQCGTVCTKDRSCQDGKVQKVEGFLASMEDVAEKYQMDIDFSRLMCY